LGCDDVIVTAHVASHEHVVFAMKALGHAILRSLKTYARVHVGVNAECHPTCKGITKTRKFETEAIARFRPRPRRWEFSPSRSQREPAATANVSGGGPGAACCASLRPGVSRIRVTFLASTGTVT